MKTIHYVSGLPRACSTLLCNLLAQNPRVHATPTSALHEIGYIARQVFQTEEAKAFGGERMEQMYYDYVRGGCSHAFDTLTTRPVVVDKCRSWIGHLDQLFKVFPDAKVLVPVRDIRGILTSFEKIHQKHPSPFHGVEQKNPAAFTTTEKRAQAFLSSPPVGIAIEHLTDAARRFKSRLFFVHAEKLTTEPAATMKAIWHYLEEEPFSGHDFDNVVQYTQENEVGFPYGDHTIRPKISPIGKEWNQFLGQKLAEQINNQFGWINTL